MTEAAEAVSGATLERVDLVDGRRLVVKRLPVDGDFMTHVTAGIARLQRMWASGLMHRAGGSGAVGMVDGARARGARSNLLDLGSPPSATASLEDLTSGSRSRFDEPLY